MLIASLLQHAAQRPGDPALLVAGRWWSWRELLQVVAANASRLEHLPPGSRVVTTFSNDASAVIGALALMAHRCVEIPLGDQRSGEDVEAIVRRCRATARLASEDVALQAVDDLDAWVGSLRRSLQSILPTDDALILWTSGTTSEPRGVVLSCGALAANAQGKLSAVPQRTDDRRLTVLPLWHSFARTCDLGTWLLSGCALAVTFGWDGMLRLAPAVNPQLLSVVPSLVKRMLLESHADMRVDLQAWGLGQLSVLGCGGAALAEGDYAAIADLGICVIHGYGLTEAGPVVCSATPSTSRPGYVGRPIRETEIRIEANGELYARGPGMMTGYLEDPSATAAMFKEGWLRTGDLAEQDSSGMVRILGRADETIVCSNGLKIQPQEIEQCLLRSAAVRHAVLWQNATGELVAVVEPSAAVVDRPDLQANLERLLEAFPRWKRPRRWVWLTQPLGPHELTAKGVPRRRVVGPKYATTATTGANRNITTR